ncbi:MAG: chromosome segregation protein SMC [Oscillospiraceae bacterium]|nr:chromosome segregation protein SMC [Oscillospiraceae bacterium]
MYIKALEIQGFKSFPEKTVLNFGEDITAIVGPNGSGKSNISDAIRWVMGEQNSRQLRGAKMEDVIFGGTEKRSQMGFAQVTLVIDNTEHIFPTRDETEVAVTRRYYRSGESEYYINKQSCRLKDVNELFMDTGMGREGYSIIGQGKIDEILSVKSGERREVFEEAAGISKFRHRKEEAERKLERTEENLVRINDKIAELELQVEPLRKQSEVAKRYLVLRDELRVLEISVWLENLQALKTAKIQLEKDVETARQDKENAERALNDTYAQAEALGEQVRQKDVEAEALRGRAADFDGRIAQAESAIAVLETAAQHNRENIDRIRAEMADTVHRAGDMEVQIQEMQRRIAAIDAESADLEREIDGLLAQARTMTDSAAGAAKTAESLRAEETIALAEAADKRSALSALRSGIHEVGERMTTVAHDLAEAREKLTAAEGEARENRKLLNAAKEDADAAGNIISGHSLRMESRRKKAEEAAAEKLQLTMDVNALTDRIHLLTEMEKEYEGFSKAVKVCMQAAGKGGLRGIHGPVANLMRTDSRYTVALEIALGAGLQNIVVDAEEDAKAAIQYLKQRDGGRATFLPMSAVRGDVLRENVSGEMGFVGIASELVEYDKQYDGIFKNLLGHTVVVEDMDCGIAMARKFRQAFRIVTLDGQVLNRGGSMTGGSVSRSAGVLSRANELRTLHDKLSAMKEKLAQAAQREEQTQRELDKANYELEVAREQQRHAEDQMLMLQGKQDHYDILIGTLSQSCQDMEAEQENLRRRVSDDEGRIADTEKAAQAAEERANQLHRQAQEAAVGQSQALEETNALSEKLAQAKTRQAALQVERQEKEGSIQRTEALRSQLKNDTSDREALIADFEGKIAQAEAEMAEHRAAIEALQGDSGALRQQMEELTRQKLALEAERDAKTRESRSCNDTLLATSQELSRMEQKLETNALQESQILDKLWENYELSHSDAMEQRIELESIPKATRRIAELNREIKGLGTPNIGAIEEYERVNTRYTYLSEQRTDVEKAKEELGGVIDEITRQMTEIFAQQFKLLNESFQETFLELFGGGKARLELENENDILNCGIEIKVQPPGKQLKTITLLSGGEKAFVAIALYFSILKVHPTPFCVMDEIEAALDESNVVRYARYMRRIAGKTQFIVITHRRGTMEEADVLYGVTMQERGVSRILTINMNDLARELNIK